MKNSKFLLILIIFIQACSTSESIFELGPNQSMSITGKGLGQDAAYNPYGETRSIAVVKNLGNTSFTVRIQFSGEIVDTIEMNPKVMKDFILEKGYELYLDSEQKGKAEVTFKKS